MSTCWIFVHDRAMYNSPICDHKGKVVMEDGSVRIFTSMREAILTAKMLGLDGFTIIGHTERPFKEHPTISDYDLYRCISTNHAAPSWVSGAKIGWLIPEERID